MTGIENFAEDRGFLILVGMIDMQITYDNGYGFGLLELCTPHNDAIPQTFYWKTEDIIDSFRKDNYHSSNIDFGFCTDFQSEYYKKLKKRKVIRNIKNSKLNFKFIEEIKLFPDLSCEICFKMLPVQKEIEFILLSLKNNLRESYVSDVTFQDNTGSISIDFQGTEFNDGKKQIREFIYEINKNSLSEKIEQICFE